MSLIFISDLHLQDSQPQVSQGLLDFLARQGPEVEALYILGDLFEAWIGDDQACALHDEIAAALAGFQKTHGPVYFIHGNRDFLLGENFAKRAQMQLLPEQYRLDYLGESYLICHGDELCTDDLPYQDFRRMTRERQWQSFFLGKSLDERQQIAQLVRAQSEQKKQQTAMGIMDVNQQAVNQLMQQQGVQRLIHGHTHRPAIHEFELDGKPCSRAVLGDWHDEGWCLILDAQGQHLERFSL